MADIFSKKNYSGFSNFVNQLVGGQNSNSTLSTPMPKPQPSSTSQATISSSGLTIGAPPRPSVTPSAPSATGTAPPKVTSPAGQQFIQNQVSSPAASPVPPASPPAAPGTPTMGSPAGVGTPTPASGTNAPAAPPVKSAKDKYLEYLNSAQVKEAQGNVNELTKRTSEEIARTRKEEETIRDNKVGQLEAGLNNRLSELARKSNRSLADIALAKGYATDVYKQLTDLGATQYEAETAAEKAITDKNAPVEVGGVLYERQEDGSYKQVAGSPSITDQYGTGAIGEYNFAKAQGYTGSFTDYQNEDANRKKSIAAAGVANSYGMNPKEQTIFNGIVDKYNKSPLVAANDRTVTLRSISSELAKNPTNSSLQVSFIYSLIQALDTYQSAVREGEIGLVSGTQGLVDKIVNLPDKISKGSILSTNKVNEYIAVAKVLTDSIQSAAKSKQKTFGKQAEINGLGEAFNEYVGAVNEGSGAAPEGGAPEDPLGIR